MQIARYFFIYLVLAFVLASLLAYPLFETLQYTLLHDTPVGQLSFRKMVDRLYLLTAAIVIIYLIKRHRLANPHLMGLVPGAAEGVSGFGLGFILGVVLVVLSGALLVSFEVRYLLDNSLGGSLLITVLASFFSALLVALVEEIFFRGILLSHIGLAGFSRLSVLISSLLYATIHFAKPGLAPEVDEVVWSSAFAVLFSTFHKLSDPQFIGSFLTLFIFGVYLCFLRIHYRHLWVSIGVHTGTAMVLKLLFETTRVDRQSSFYWLVGNYDQITGYLTALVLVTLLSVHWLLVRRPGSPD